MQSSSMRPEGLLPLIDILSDGGLWSGQLLASRLGVSRSAVAKQIARLDALGLSVHRIRSRGYRLEHPIERLSAERIESLLPDQIRAQISGVHVLLTTESTNQAALDLGRGDSVGSVAVVLAEHQYGGRGRRGRQWVSPFGRNLYLTLLRRFARPARDLTGLSIAVGMAVAASLRTFGVEGAMIKWPNDIVVGDSKLGGVLIELEGDIEGPVQVAIGVGINVSMPVTEALGIDQPWTDVRQASKSCVSRDLLAAGTVAACCNAFAELESDGFAGFRSRWAGFDAVFGRPLRVIGASKIVEGVGAGIDVSGALLLDTDHGRIAVSAGEVSVRASR